ncbi:MAG: hypothetical protein H7099_15195, partial [Gemmatimonadaceae bacterium]|nr:hypothetical protein [Gemmatimonadaceae bacterium]
RGSAADSGAVAVDTTTVVSLDRGACHGTFPIYTVFVQADGGVRFSGARFVRPVGTDSTRITAAEVAALQAAFAAREFRRVPSTIEYDSPGCGAYVADLPTVELTVSGEGGAHRVRWDEGCRDHPRMLDTLARMVDSVSGTSRWTTVSRP